MSSVKHVVFPCCLFALVASASARAAANTLPPGILRDGVHQIHLAYGDGTHASGRWSQDAVSIRGNEAEGASAFGQFSYRYAITDRLQYQFPLVFGYRFDGPAGMDLTVAAGLNGVGYSSVRGGFVLLPRVTLAAAHRLGGTTARVIGSGEVYPHIYDRDDVDVDGYARGGFSVDPVSWLTLSAGAALDASGRSVGIGGVATDGYFPLPLVLVHLSDSWDICADASAWYDMREKTAMARVVGGVRWTSRGDAEAANSVTDL